MVFLPDEEIGIAALANTAMLFIITTAFFSTVAVGYLLYYFALVFLLHIGGRKIVQKKLINISNNIALDLMIDLINKIFSTIFSNYHLFKKLYNIDISNKQNDIREFLFNWE